LEYLILASIVDIGGIPDMVMIVSEEGDGNEDEVNK